MGFPLFADYEDRGRGVEQLGGDLSPLSTGPDGGHVLDQAAYPRQDSDHAWSGVSGAAVFCAGFLVGVVVKDDDTFENRRLHAVPVRDFAGHPEFVRLVGEDTGSPPVAEPLELAELLDTRLERVRAKTPGSLLAAAAEVVDFHGREDPLAALTAWRDESLPFSLTLITGEGGAGKTRLGREFARKSRQAGWVAGFTIKAPRALPPEQQKARAEHLARRLRSSTAPALIVSDYAEAHPVFVDTLASALTEVSPQRRVRLLLLSRTTGAWWDGLGELLGEAASRLRLEPFGDEDAARTYVAAVSGLAGWLPELPELAIGHPPVRPWEVLAAKLASDLTVLPARFGNALTLQMTALLDLLHMGAGEERTVGVSPERHPEQDLVKHERDYLKRVAAAKHLLDEGKLSAATDQHERERQAVRALDRALAGLILLGPCGSGLAEAVGGLAGETHAKNVTSWLRTLYPPAPGEGMALGQVQPDRLAEFLLGGILVEHLATEGDESRPLVHACLLSEIGSLARDLDTAQSVLFALVRTAAHPRFTSEVGEQTAELIVEHPDPFAAAAPFLAVTPAHRGLLLAGLHRLAKHDPASLRNQIGRAGDLLPKFSVSLAFFSAAVTEILTELFHTLADQDRDAYLPDLATSLNNHAAFLAQTGHRTEAIPISEEAVRLRQELANQNPDAYLPDLATSLNNHALHLAETGRRTEAIPISEEAVTLYRELANQNPDAYLPDLAMSLNNHALRLAETGRRTEAIPISEEAVRLRQELANQNRDAYLPDYTQSVTVLGYVLIEDAQFREAIAPLVEAFTVGRQLPEYAQDIIMAIVDLLRRAYAGGTPGVTEEFRTITGQDVPGWMKERPASEK